jgi:cytochrome P450
MTMAKRAACPVHAAFDPLSPAFLADPFAVLDSLPREMPPFYASSIDYYVVTRYTDIETVFLDHDTHSAASAQLPLVQIASILYSLTFAGHETTNYLIGNVVRRLLEDPALWDAVVADPGLIPGAVDETLRYDPSVPVWRRVTKRPVTLGGVDLPEGAKLFLWLAASGRDASVFPAPATFDLRRANATKALAFGKGVHYCLGAALGRLEAQVALDVLTRVFPRLRLVEGQRLSFHPNISFRGPEALWVRAT